MRARTGTTLDHVDNELIIKFTAHHSFRGGNDRIGNDRIEHTKFVIRERCCLLDSTERMDKRRRRADRNTRDWEVLDTAQCLHAVVHIIGKVPLAQEVRLCSHIVKCSRYVGR